MSRGTARAKRATPAKKPTTTDVVATKTGYVWMEKGAKVRSVSHAGNVVCYKGPAGQERCVSLHIPAKKDTYYYAGPKGQERKVRRCMADGTVVYYEGERGAERIVRSCKDKATRHYTYNAEGDLRLVRMQQGNETSYYDEEERLVRTTMPGKVIHYEGETWDTMRMVRQVLGCGAVIHHEGPRDEERIVRVEYNDVYVEYAGRRGHEYVVDKNYDDEPEETVARRRWAWAIACVLKRERASKQATAAHKAESERRRAVRAACVHKEKEEAPAPVVPLPPAPRPRAVSPKRSEALKCISIARQHAHEQRLRDQEARRVAQEEDRLALRRLGTLIGQG